MMNSERQNQLIAEWEGKDCECPKNYFHDLNAIHGAVNRLDLSGRLEWLHHLDEATVDPDDKQDQAWFPLRASMATAAQRCEALLRTIGKWDEE